MGEGLRGTQLADSSHKGSSSHGGGSKTLEDTVFKSEGGHTTSDAGHKGGSSGKGGHDDSEGSHEESDSNDYREP